MSEIDALPPDQRAVLQLVLRQGRSYDELAGLLAIDPDGVRARAYAALDTLGPDAEGLTPDRRGELADYLLGQQSLAEREQTRDFLAGSPPARAWARVVAGTLRPLAPEALPDIPEEGTGAVEVEEPTFVEEAVAGAPAGAPDEADLRPPFVGPPAQRRPTSRLGGALLLGGVGIVAAVILVLVLSGGSSDNGGKANKLSSSPSSTSTQSTSGQPTPIAQVNLFSTTGSSRTVGLAQIFRRGSQRVIIVAGQGVAPGAYALWLYNSASSSKLLGFVPQRVGAAGRFVTQGDLPTDASRFQQLIVTRETVSGNTLPKRPGSVVLRGRLRLQR